MKITLTVNESERTYIYEWRALPRNPGKIEIYKRNNGQLVPIVVKVDTYNEAFGHIMGDINRLMIHFIANATSEVTFNVKRK